MNNSIHIDTRENKSIFSLPENESNYAEWLIKKYESQQYKDGAHTCCFGLAQKIQGFLQSKDIPSLIIIGPNAVLFEKFIINAAVSSGKQIKTEVING